MASGSATVTISSDNGGTVIADKETSPGCFFRQTSQYGPREWGARQDGNTDDTVPLQSWINANQPHIATPGNSSITQPLICGESIQHSGQSDASIQGAPVLAVGQSPAPPPFEITAAAPGSTPPFTGSAMFVMASGVRCALHGVGLIANAATSTPYNTVDVYGADDVIDGHSLLTGGTYNLYTEPGAGSNVEMYDSAANQSVIDNVYISSNDAKISRNAISTAGGNNITVSDVADVLIADNNIQNAKGWGLYATSSHVMRVNSNLFAENGTGSSSGDSAVSLNGIGDSSFCDNTFAWNAAATEGIAPTSDILFSGANNNLTFCGNSYRIGANQRFIGIRPDYVFDVAPSSTPLLSNITIADNPQWQNSGVYTSNAMQYLGSAATRHIPQNYLTGLTLSNAGTLQVHIAPGEASDSTGSAIINNSSGCTVNLGGPNGVGGLDQHTAAAHTTYYIFIISGYGGANPNCIASTSPAPTFINTGTTYEISEPAFTTQNSPMIFNIGGMSSGALNKPSINPLAAMAAGDTITSGSGLFSPTTIASVSSFYVPQATGNWTSASANTITNIPASSALAQVSPNMLVALAQGGFSFSGGPQLIQSVCYGSPPTCVLGSPTTCTPGGASYYCVVLTQSLSCTSGCTSGPVAIAISGQFTISLQPPSMASSSSTSTTVNVYDGYYRMVGMLKTDGTPDFPAFTQDNDTFILRTPIPDVNASIGVVTPNTLPLGSVPGGVPVEALGRCVASSTTAGAYVRVFTPVTIPPASPSPQAFPNSPGYSIETAGTTIPAGASLPYRIYTDSSANIMAQASVPAMLNCMTDGWVLKRVQ